MNTTAIELAKYSNSYFMKYSILENAVEYAKSKIKPMIIVLGCDDLFWVCSPRLGSVLKNAGYNVVEY